MLCNPHDLWPSTIALKNCYAGYGSFLTGWGKTSLAKTLLRPVITLSSYWLGHQALADNFLVCTLWDSSLQFIVIAYIHFCCRRTPC